MSEPFCPHCGFDLKKDEPIILNQFSMIGAGGQLSYMSLPIGLTHYENMVAWTLMKAAPNPVAIDVILDRIGSESSTNSIYVMVCRIRKKMRALGIDDPLRTARVGDRRAYRWVIEQQGSD